MSLSAPQLSLHERIRSDVEDRILSGAWPPGHRIPYEHELTAQYGCSRMTVSKALGQLADAGLIERRKKAGSFVRRPQAQSAVLEIHDIAAEVESLGRSYAYLLLARSRRRATRQDRTRLGVALGASLIALGCRHDANGRPFCLEERLINLDAVPAAAEADFAATPPGAWLVAHVPWTVAEHRIRAESADPRLAAALALAQGAACLVVERRTWAGDAPVTHVTQTYPGAAHELVARFSPESR
jgi:GntR family histidine utilization transcriptional repressor